MTYSNLDSQALNNLQASINNELSIKDQLIKKNIKESNDKFNKILKDSNIKDSNIMKMLAEINNSEGDYKKRIETLTSTYISEQKLSKTEQAKVSKVLNSLNDNNRLAKEATIIQRKREAKENPLSAFTHAFDTFKETKSIKESSS